MGRKTCCEKAGLNKGPWTIDEDHKLVNFIINNGVHSWPLVPKLAGLLRCGNSCRLRWINYLRPDLKRGGFTEKEDNQIIKLHSHLGNRWSKISAHFPGRTDNEIKNQWNTRIKKKMMLLGLEPVTNNKIDQKEHTDDKNKTNLKPSSSKGPERKESVEIMSLDSHAMEEMSKTEGKREEDKVTLNDDSPAENAMEEVSKAQGRREDKVPWDDYTDTDLLDYYEMIRRRLELKSRISQGINSSVSFDNSLSVDDSNHLSIGESSYVEDNTLQLWVDGMDPIP